MGQYYQHSVLTIAATSATDDGLLTTRASDSTASTMKPLMRLPYRDKSGVQAGWFYVQQRETSARDEYRKAVLDSVLLSRGWVFQEWMLSRRLIHYTKGQLWFECQSDVPRNESADGAHVFNVTLERYWHRDDLASLKNAFTTGALPTNVLWCRLVEVYSGLCLTQSTDRLVAIAGIAKEAGAMMASEASQEDLTNVLQLAYVSGWWLRDIHMGLLWEQKKAGALHESACEAPSWSWASSEVAVHWRSAESHMEPACKVVRLITREEVTSGKHDERSSSSSSNPKFWNVDNKFACLEIRAKTSLVLLGPPLIPFYHAGGALRNMTTEEWEDEMKRVGIPDLAAYTGVKMSGGSGSTARWKAISSPEAPGYHIGWADIEDRFLKPQAQDQDGTKMILEAMHVSTQKGVSGGLQFGRYGFTHDVYAVLFIMPCQFSSEHPSALPDRYVRVGVGRIFKQDFFKDGREATVRLV